MLKGLLIALFSTVLIAMIAVTTYASLQCSILDVPSVVTQHAWFRATLADAYFGFITFYVWVFYKERTPLARIIWFVLIMALGNIAMAVYMLLQLARWDATQGVRRLLLTAKDVNA